MTEIALEVVHRRKCVCFVRAMSDEHDLIQHIGIASVQFKQQSARGTDMKTDLAIHRRITCYMMVDDAGVNQVIAILFHKLLQRTQTETAGSVRIDGEPLFGNLRLKVHMRRGSKGDILRTG